MTKLACQCFVFIAILESKVSSVFKGPAGLLADVKDQR